MALNNLTGLMSAAVMPNTLVPGGKGPVIPGAAGLMGVGKQSPSAPVNATGYNPQLLGQVGTPTTQATASGFTPTTGSASTYDPSSVNTAGTTYDPAKVNRNGTTYDPTTQSVQDNQLTSNQLTGLLSGNSKYMQDARQQGLEQAARSGLLTSSIAAGNSERSAIQAGLPIAQADAARFGTVADQNMAATNTAGQFNAGANLSASSTDANATNQAGQFNAGSALSAAAADAAAKNTAGQVNSAAENNMTGANMSAVNAAAASNAAAVNNTSQFNAASQNSASATNAGAINTAGQFNAASSNAATQQNASLPISREQQMSQVLEGIYSNSNLTAAQQQQAALNAKAVLGGLWSATNATFAAGAPQIFGPAPTTSPSNNAPPPQAIAPPSPRNGNLYAPNGIMAA